MTQMPSAVRRSFESSARRFHLAAEMDDRAGRFTVSPQAEGVAVRVEEVRQGLELFPLLLVMALVFAGVGAFAGGLDFDESDQRLAKGNGVIRPGFQTGDRGFADGVECASGQSGEFREVAKQHLERRTQLVFGFSTD
jgi:hypothetical protein